MCGPLFGGFLYRYVSYSSSFILCAALVVLDGVARFYLIPDALVPLSHAPISERDTVSPPLPPPLPPPIDDADIVNHSPWADAPHPDPFDGDAHAFATAEAGAASMSTTQITTTAVDAAAAANDDAAGAADVDAVPLELREASLRSMWALACQPYLATNLLCWLTSTAVFAALEPILPLHFARVDVLDATPDEVGSLFFALVLPYVLACYPAGILSDRFNKRLVMTAGLVIVCVCAPLACLPRRAWLEAVTLVPIGVGLAFCTSPASADAAAHVEARGWASVNAQVSSLINIAYSFGSFAGPLVAAALVENASTTAAFAVLGGVGCLLAPPVYHGRFVLFSTTTATTKSSHASQEEAADEAAV